MGIGATGTGGRLTEQSAELDSTRRRTLALVSELSDEDLARVVDPLLSPLLWDLGHIANFEQRWLLGADQSDLDELYNPFLQPRASRGELPLLSSDDCFDYMSAVRERVNDLIGELDPYLVELVIQHEQQHNETMLQLLRQLPGYVPPRELREAFTPPPAGPQHIRLRETAARAFRPASRGAGADWVDFPAGSYEVGTRQRDPEQMVYDNEMTAHKVHLEAFRIATRPVSNGEFREWIELGGYRKREWWSEDGLAWLDEVGTRMPLGWRRDGDDYFVAGFGGVSPLDERAPVCHVNWYEADAYARAHGARLPTEFEWEVAASYDPRDGAAGTRRRYAWGDSEWVPGAANLDQLAFGTLPSGAADHGYGLIDVGGQVWEWTSSEFSAYPGFEPFCYEDYSQPFFDSGYRVLRGGSWATRPRTVSNAFRNWDLPQRRQIFSGLRLARSAA